jgi:hypothetical protein
MVVLQAGVAPPHWESAVHGTHVFAVVLQTGVVPVHAVLLVEVHWTQLLLTHAGVLPWQSESLLHWTQPPADELHT